ncbi:MAG: enoyl-CoA hydratase/isomerase family protein [Thermoplasmatota archaeon]
MVLRTEIDDGVAILTFDNAERMNSFDAETLRHMRAAFREALDHPDVRALVLTGSGKAFSTGADVGAFHESIQAGTSTQFVLDATAELHPLMLELHGASKPLIAAVNGVAAGGGLGLALVADARIGSDAARFAAGYFGIGVSPDGGATWLLPRLIGEQRTRRFLFDNEIMDADTAHAAGLLDELVPADELLSRAVALARRWGRWAAHSRESTKRLLEASLSNDFVAQLDMERGLIAAAAGTTDFREGVAAFIEKRKPDFA